MFRVMFLLFFNFEVLMVVLMVAETIFMVCFQWFIVLFNRNG